jgi:hypothetical protein
MMMMMMTTTTTMTVMNVHNLIIKYLWIFKEMSLYPIPVIRNVLQDLCSVMPLLFNIFVNRKCYSCQHKDVSAPYMELIPL